MEQYSPYYPLFSIPEFPDKNFRALDVIDNKRKEWAEKYPQGVFEIYPSVNNYYVYSDKPKILYQIVKKSKDYFSFREGNYEEDFVFYNAIKDYGEFPFQYFHFEKWYKPVFYEWAAGFEIPKDEILTKNIEERNKERYRHYKNVTTMDNMLFI